MPIDIEKLYVYRIMAITNLADIIKNGLYCKNGCPKNDRYITIANKEIIEQRDERRVTCYPATVVNDFVPFYFSIRTPMLYNIHTNQGVESYPQKNIIYLCFKLSDLTTDEFQWCYTDGNAAKAITKFFKSLDNIDKHIDWHSITTTDFRNANSDGDNDRVRKKHSEFLVKTYVPSRLIRGIVVINEEKKMEVEDILKYKSVNIKVIVSPPNKYFFQ
jgi:ssDNA thymidine ADP-ribosyltransferase, DarT